MSTKTINRYEVNRDSACDKKKENYFSSSYQILNWEESKDKIEEIVEAYKLLRDYTKIKLILYELVANAYMHGNGGNQKLPIGVEVIRSKNELVVKVKDSNINKKAINIRQEMLEKNIMKENGRGLYILSQICKRIYSYKQAVIAEYRLEGGRDE